MMRVEAQLKQFMTKHSQLQLLVNAPSTHAWAGGIPAGVWWAGFRFGGNLGGGGHGKTLEQAIKMAIVEAQKKLAQTGGRKVGVREPRIYVKKVGGKRRKATTGATLIKAATALKQALKR